MTTALAPAAVFLGHLEPGTPEWSAARAGALGGSEVAAALGLSKWDSPFSLHFRKRGLVPDRAEVREMDAGKRLEDAVCQWFADQYPGDYAIGPGGSWRNVERPWQVGAPDRLLYAHREDCDGRYHAEIECCVPAAYGLSPTAILEAKVSRDDEEWGEEGTDEIPPYYRCQVLWYLDCLGLDIAHVAVLVAQSLEFREYTITRDAAAEADIALLRERGRAFLDAVEAGVPPDLDSHGQTYLALRHLHPDIDEVTVDVPDDVGRWYVQALAALREAEDEATAARSALLDVMGAAKWARWQGEKIAVRKPTRNGGTPCLSPARGVPERLVGL